MRKPEFVFNYRVRNLSSDIRALVERGSLTLWVNPRALDSRRATTMAPSRGRPRT